MASTNKTEFLKLSQFVGDDVPSWLADYNADMRIVDSNVHTALQGIEEAESKIDSLTESVTSLQTLTAEHTEQIASAAANITVLREDVDALKHDMDDAQARLTEAEADILTNAGNIATNAENITKNSEAITSAQAAIATNAEAIATNSGNILALEAKAAFSAQNVALLPSAVTLGFTTQGFTQLLAAQDGSAFKLTSDIYIPRTLSKEEGVADGKGYLLYNVLYTENNPFEIVQDEVTVIGLHNFTFHTTHASANYYTFMKFDGTHTIFGVGLKEDYIVDAGYLDRDLWQDDYYIKPVLL